jgi:anti-sigma28 factor (negative regulator of flagellin synthesis)
MRTKKAVSKKGKTEKQNKSLSHKDADTFKEWPSEEDIREKAMEIYHQRIERGEYGNAETDWLEAERYLMEE